MLVTSKVSYRCLKAKDNAKGTNTLIGEWRKTLCQRRRTRVGVGAKEVCQRSGRPNIFFSL